MNPTQEKPAAYEPRDPHFFLLSSCMLSAALVPATASPVYHASDHLDAEDTARKAAQLLDGGAPPDGFLLRVIARRMAEVREYQATIGVMIDQRHSSGMPARIGTAAEVERARKREAERAQKEGPLPTIDELKAQNQKELDAFRDLSEPVRDAALRASAVRLAATTEITGAREEEALGIVCEEILRALRVAGELGIGTKGLTEGADLAEIAAGTPYPANLAAFALVGAVDPEDEPDTSPGGR